MPDVHPPLPGDPEGWSEWSRREIRAGRPGGPLMRRILTKWHPWFPSPAGVALKGARSLTLAVHNRLGEPAALLCAAVLADVWARWLTTSDPHEHIAAHTWLERALPTARRPWSLGCSSQQGDTRR